MNMLTLHGDSLEMRWQLLAKMMKSAGIPNYSNTWLILALHDLENSINRMFTDTHYISLSHLLSAPSTDSESSKGKIWSRMNNYVSQQLT
jgi:hypothetical protein